MIRRLSPVKGAAINEKSVTAVSTDNSMLQLNSLPYHLATLLLQKRFARGPGSSFSFTAPQLLSSCEIAHRVTNLEHRFFAEIWSMIISKRLELYRVVVLLHTGFDNVVFWSTAILSCHLVKTNKSALLRIRN